MTQSYATLIVHIVFSTKNREPWFMGPRLRAEVHAYLAALCRNNGSPALIVNGASEHVHILCHLSKNHALKDLVLILKRESTKWIKHRWPALAGFHWQRGYGAFSVSTSQSLNVHKYIQNQAEHHKHRTYEQEFVTLLNRNGIGYDQRYIWD